MAGLHSVWFCYRYCISLVISNCGKYRCSYTHDIAAFHSNTVESWILGLEQALNPSHNLSETFNIFGKFQNKNWMPKQRVRASCKWKKFPQILPEPGLCADQVSFATTLLLALYKVLASV